MLSKQGIKIDQGSMTIESAVDTNAEDIGQGVMRQLSPVLEPGEVMPDVVLTLKLMKRAVRASANAALGADGDHQEELAEEKPEIRKRNELRAPFEQRLVRLRPVVISTYGDRAAEVVGFKGPVPDDSVLLAEWGLGIAKNMPSLHSWPTLSEDVHFNPVAVASSLEAQAQAFKDSLVALGKSRRETETAMVKKNAEADRHAVVFRGVATTVEGFALLAGMPEISDRVRPSQVKKGQTEVEPTPPAAPPESSELG